MKKAFSLIELIIVIVIIGVVYTLVISKLQNYGEQKASPTLSNLKEYLLSHLEDVSSSARLVCLNECLECDIYVDDVKTKSIKSFFDTSIEKYTYDMKNGIVLSKEDVFFNKENVQESVCFSFKVRKDLTAEQSIVLYKDRAYDYSTYFENTLVYDSIEELEEAREELQREILQ